VLRDRREEDAEGIARLSIESSVYYSLLAPDLFTPAQENGLAEWG
jgi:hypothetical protein